MTAVEIFIIAAGAVVAGFVQGLSGFGFGLVALSIWIWFLPPPLAAALSVFGSLTGQIVAAITVKRTVPWAVVAPFLAGGVLGVPLGLILLPHLDVTIFKAALGTVLLVVCPLLLMSGRLPAITVGGRSSDAIAGAVGGAMSALGGLSGVVPSLWSTLRGFDKVTQRHVIQTFNLSILAFTFIAYLATGHITFGMVPQLAVVAIAVLVPVLIGARVYAGISDQQFKRIVLGLLTASGLVMLLSTAPSLWTRLQG
ncbi:sulfite exporter TauE/SafE family protein [Alcaligenaceae bacterium B3P038]|nr:sulfite exporter TauE/SafE family protein [Alcaligenaceae bacterium B3P038]